MSTQWRFGFFLKGRYVIRKLLTVVGFAVVVLIPAPLTASATGASPACNVLAVCW
ncbi:hypothetical protein EV649_6220 [Kribbella sp. VKM Ac-2569]|nr:hypothetical protein EV649_6220 [Kribbella sp. VKM Ac-2569]